MKRRIKTIKMESIYKTLPRLQELVTSLNDQKHCPRKKWNGKVANIGHYFLLTCNEGKASLNRVNCCGGSSLSLHKEEEYHILFDIIEKEFINNPYTFIISRD